jgi:DNA-binding protein HU-beta
MNKNLLVRDLARKFELPISKTDKIVTALLESITKNLAKGEDVTFMGFGSFSVKKRLARVGRNPGTGEKIKISARKAVKFSAGAVLKQAINKK